MHSRFLKLTAVCGLLTILGTTPALGQFKKIIPTQSELKLPSQSKLRQQALQITVRVSASDDSGSGTLLTKQGNLYTVLTNAHVLISGAPFKVQTPDGQDHSATLLESISLQGKDLALLQFQSKHEYKVASLAKVPKLAVEGGVVAAGFPYNSNRPLVTTGKISLLPNQPLEAGYQIGYSNDIQQGMSGGPILNEHGQLVGINALSAYPILNTAYVFEDGSRPSEKQIAEMRRSNWGVPIQILDKIVPQVLTKALGPCVEPSAMFNKSTKSVQGYHVSTCDASNRTDQSTLLAQNTSKDFYNRAQERAKAGDFSGAVTELTKAIELEPKNTDALLARAGAYRTLGQIENSIADYTRIIKLDSSFPYVYHYERGIDYSDSRKYNEAINDFTQIIQWKVKDRKEEEGLYGTLKENAYWRRGLVYKQLNKYDLAVKDLTQILGSEILSFRDIGIAYLARGDIYLIQGNRQQAVEDWSKAAKLPPPENVSEGRKKVEQIAQSITVKIELLNKDNQIKSSGSGILAAGNGKEYYVVTNRHVVNNESGNYWIVTPDKKRYLVNRNSIKTQPGFDLAVVQFSSDQPYTVATFADYGIISGTRQVVTAGWSTKGSKWHSTNGFMIPADFLIGSALDSSFLSDGYELSYTNVTYGGMSGGPVLDALGQVVGIHGHKVGSNLTDIAWGLGMAIPSNAFLRLSKDIGIDPKWLKRSQTTPRSTDENEIVSFDSLSYSPDEYNIRVMLLLEDTAHKPETWFNLANQLALRADGNSANLVNPAFDIGFELRKSLESSEPDQIYDSLLAKVVPLMPDKAALQFLDTAVAANRERFQAWGLKASVLRSLKEPNQALFAVDEALKIEPNNPGLLLQKGYLHIDINQPKQAIAAYTQAINRYEEQYKQREVVPYYVAHFYRVRATAYRKAGDRTSAIKDLSRAIAINPGGGSCEELFELYSEAGDQRATQAAICNLETTARRFEGNLPISGDLIALQTRGTARLLQGNYDEAVELFTQAISEHQRLSSKTLPDNLYSWRGQALFGLKKYKEALADFEQAIKLNPNKGSHYVQRGLVRGQRGDSQGAMADFDRAIKTEPDNAEAYFYRSLVYAARRDMPKAFSDMQKAAELFKARKDGVNHQTALKIMQQWRQNNQPQ